MSRLSIEVTPEQHNAIKAMALLEGKTIKDLILKKFEHELMHQKKGKKVSDIVHDDCQICNAYGGKNKKYKKLKPSDMKIVGKYKTAKDMFADLFKE